MKCVLQSVLLALTFTSVPTLGMPWEWMTQPKKAENNVVIFPDTLVETFQGNNNAYLDHVLINLGESMLAVSETILIISSDLV